jgi:pyruvate-ferredoxin/flavodoxin oxidoreductase
MEICPAKTSRNRVIKPRILRPIGEAFKHEKKNYEPFYNISYLAVCALGTDRKSMQFRRFLFELSGAHIGCGEAPYVTLLTQLFGDRVIIANATDCSPIYGGTFQRCPIAKFTMTQTSSGEFSV